MRCAIVCAFGSGVKRRKSEKEEDGVCRIAPGTPHKALVGRALAAACEGRAGGLLLAHGGVVVGDGLGDGGGGVVEGLLGAGLAGEHLFDGGLHGLAGGGEDADQSALCNAVVRCGVELVDKAGSRAAFLEGRVAHKLRATLSSIDEEDPGEETMDEFLGYFDALLTTPVTMH